MAQFLEVSYTDDDNYSPSGYFVRKYLFPIDKLVSLVKHSDDRCTIMVQLKDDFIDKTVPLATYEEVKAGLLRLLEGFRMIEVPINMECLADKYRPKKEEVEIKLTQEQIDEQNKIEDEKKKAEVFKVIKNGLSE